MTPFFSNRSIAADAFEELVEGAIVRADQLYDLDGETFLRSRDGRIETASWEDGQ